MKTIVIGLMVGASISLILFTLICVNVLPKWSILLYVTSILGGLFVNGSIPLFFELAVESTYPIAEGITAGCLTFSNNFLQVVFYIFPMVPNFGTRWINWAAFSSCLMSIPLLAVWKAKYYRSQIDRKAPYVPIHGPISYGATENGGSINSSQGDCQKLKDPIG
jgi:FLVCR family MFS transporter